MVSINALLKEKPPNRENTVPKKSYTHQFHSEIRRPRRAVGMNDGHVAIDGDGHQRQRGHVDGQTLKRRILSPSFALTSFWKGFERK